MHDRLVGHWQHSRTCLQGILHVIIIILLPLSLSLSLSLSVSFCLALGCAH